MAQIDESSLDQGGDKVKTARSAILLAVQFINKLLGYRTDDITTAEKTAARNALGVSPSGNRANWADKYVLETVVGMLPWQNYGNYHVVFDASKGISPNGTTISKINAEAGWQAGFPILMGWNGINTHGMRVDSARIADRLIAGAPAGPGAYTNWQNVALDRNLNVTYTNTTGCPRQIKVTLIAQITNYLIYINIRVGGLIVGQYNFYPSAMNQTVVIDALIPTGATYMIVGNQTQCPINSWDEVN